MKPTAVHLDGLRLTYPGRSEPTLRDISFRLPRGSFTLLVGPTGSGKSTLLRALAGIAPEHASGRLDGSIRIHGDEVRQLSAAQRAARVGLVLQSPDDQLCARRAENEVAFGLENRALAPEEIGPRVATTLELVGLSAHAQQLSHTLSGGQKQRLMLASLDALAPEVLLLDEPLSQLDPPAAAEFLALLKARHLAGLTIVLAEHRLADVWPLADQVLLLDGGRLLGLEATDSPRLAEAMEAVGVWRPGKGARGATRDVQRQASADLPIIAKVESASFAYPSQPILWSDVSFELRQGEVVALVGPNGCGKSTLLAALAGMLPLAQGSISVAGRRPQPPLCGLVLQQPDRMLLCDSVRDELALGLRRMNLPAEEVAKRIARVADQFDLESLLDEPPTALSQGQRLRTAVAATVAMAPKLLLLDEPTTGQDPSQVRRVLNSVRQSAHESGGAVLLATHDYEVLRQYADRVLLLEDGKLWSIEPAQAWLSQAAESTTTTTTKPHAKTRRREEDEDRNEKDQSSRISIFASSRLRVSPFLGDVSEQSTDSSAFAPPWIERLDPRTKLAALAAMSVASVLLDAWPGLVVLVALSMLLASGLTLGRRGWLALLGLLTAVAWGTSLSQAMFYEGEPRTTMLTLIPAGHIGSWSHDGLRLYREGFAYGAAQSLRMVALLLAGLTLSISTSPERLLAALARLRVPSALGFLTVTALRSIPGLAEEHQALRRAWWLRGGRPHDGGMRSLLRWTHYLWEECRLIRPLLAQSLRRAAVLAESVSARGFDPAARRTFWPPLRMARGEKLFVFLILVSLAALSSAKAIYWLYLAELFYHPQLLPLYDFVRQWL